MIGRLRDRVGLLAPVDSDDDRGGYTRTFQLVASLWALVTPASTSRTPFSDSPAREPAYDVVVRRREDIRRGWRLNWRGRLLRVEEVLETDRRGGFITLKTHEVTGHEP